MENPEFKFFWNDKKHTWNYWAYWPDKTRTFICSWPAYQPPTQFELDNIRRVFLRGLSCRKETFNDSK